MEIFESEGANGLHNDHRSKLVEKTIAELVGRQYQGDYDNLCSESPKTALALTMQAIKKVCNNTPEISN